MSVTHPITNLGDIVATSIAADPITTQPIAIPDYAKQGNDFTDTFATLNNPDPNGQTFTGYNSFEGGIAASAGTGAGQKRSVLREYEGTIAAGFVNVLSPGNLAVLQVPDHTAAQDYIATTELAQTLNNKTLVTPVIASLKQASSGGTINMPTVASGESITLATTADVPTLPSNLVSTDGTQTITGVKTLTSPVFTDGTHTISMPAAANLTANTTFATALDIASLEESLSTLESNTASSSDFVVVRRILGNVITYLKNWVNVGNLNMSDIVGEVDEDNYLGLVQDSHDPRL